MEIKTERYSLRPLGNAGVTEEYFAWWEDAALQKNFNLRPAAREAVLKFIDAIDGAHRRHLGIYAGGRLIGYMTVIVRGHVASSAICIGDPDYRGQGAITEVRRAVFKALFAEGIDKIEGMVYGEQPASVKSYLAMGFQHEGTARQRIPAVAGGLLDVHYYGLLKSEWQHGD